MSKSGFKRKLNFEAPYKQYSYGKKQYTTEFISASQLHAYFMNDPILDFLNRHGQRLGFKRNSEIEPSEYNFSNFIMNLGNIWEDKVVDHITKLVGKENTIVIKSDRYQKFVVSAEIMQSALLNKVPIIFQAYQQAELYNDKFHGYVDVLCRLDYLEKIFVKDEMLDMLINDYKSKSIDYVAIDIKTTNFNKTNQSDTSYYEYINAQLHIYSKMNNINSKFAIFIGRQLLTKDNRIQAKVVDIDKEYIADKISNTVKWLRRLENDGDSWVILPTPSVPELYPNMKNNQDGEWSIAKSEIAKQLKEITDLYYLGYSKRQYCHNRNIYSYTDPEFVTVIQETFRKSPALRSINGNNLKEDSSVLTNILNIVKAQNGEMKDNEIMKVDSDIHTKYIYIDIETIYNFYSCIYDDYNSEQNQFIIQIGIGFVNNNNKWVYKSFEMKLLTNREENRIISECRDYLQAVLDMCEKICFVYYTKAENKIVDTLIRNLVYPIVDKPISTLDLNQVWMQRKIYFKGLLNYRLKEIVKVCKSKGLIDLNYDNLLVKDGSDAMALFMIEDKKAKDNNSSNISDTAVAHLKRYNEVDCKALYEIHRLLYKI
jgi:hypothetical protein